MDAMAAREQNGGEIRAGPHPPVINPGKLSALTEKVFAECAHR
ncbi:hypothetical protein [Micromonospora matsumotoense]